MSILDREKFEVLKSPMVILLLILIVAALGSFWLYGGGSKSSGSTYFYDLDEGKIFTADLTDGLPPILSPYSGKETGAYIFIYSCGECGSFDGDTLEEVEAAGGIPGYLVVYSEQARAMSKQGRMQDLQYGRLVKRQSDPKWVPSSIYESTFEAEARSGCGEAKAKLCQP